MTQSELENKLKSEYKEIPQYKKAAVTLINDGVIIIKNYDYTARIYRLLPNGEIETIANNITRHRAEQVKQSIMTGTWDKIDADVRRNYCTNGYNTRGGLYADYNKKLNRIQRITQSHIEVLESGKDAHDERVYLRNRKIKEE